MRRSSVRGVTLIEILAVTAIVAVLATIAVMLLLGYLSIARAEQCGQHLVMYEEAFTRYRLKPENRAQDPGTVALADLVPYLPGQRSVDCADGGVYTLQASSGRVFCSKDPTAAGQKRRHNDGR